MGDPAREVERGCGSAQVHGIGTEQQAVVEEVTHVVQRHDHHDDAAEQIEGKDALVQVGKVGLNG